MHWTSSLRQPYWPAARSDENIHSLFTLGKPYWTKSSQDRFLKVFQIAARSLFSNVTWEKTWRWLLQSQSSKKTYNDNPLQESSRELQNCWWIVCHTGSQLRLLSVHQQSTATYWKPPKAMFLWCRQRWISLFNASSCKVWHIQQAWPVQLHKLWPQTTLIWLVLQRIFVRVLIQTIRSDRICVVGSTGEIHRAGYATWLLVGWHFHIWCNNLKSCCLLIPIPLWENLLSCKISTVSCLKVVVQHSLFSWWNRRNFMSHRKLQMLLTLKVFATLQWFRLAGERLDLISAAEWGFWGTQV